MQDSGGWRIDPTTCAAIGLRQTLLKQLGEDLEIFAETLILRQRIDDLDAAALKISDVARHQG